jgi:hypothetical protein
VCVSSFEPARTQLTLVVGGAQDVHAAGSAAALASCVVDLQAHLTLPCTSAPHGVTHGVTHLGSAHDGWGMSNVDSFASVRAHSRADWRKPPSSKHPTCSFKRPLSSLTPVRNMTAHDPGDPSLQFGEWWKKLLKALSNAGHAEAGALASASAPARASKHRAPPTGKTPKLTHLVKLAMATLDDLRDGDVETPLWRCVVAG